MAQRDCVGSNQDFLHQQAQELLSYRDIDHFCAEPQFAAKTGQALRQLLARHPARDAYGATRYAPGLLFATK